MAKIIVDPYVPGNDNRKCRKMRRLVYLAWIARDLGHEVAVHYDRDEIDALRQRTAYNGRTDFSYLDLLGSFRKCVASEDADLLICSEETALGQQRPDCKVAAWRSVLGGGHRAVEHHDKFDLLCGYAFSQQDWTRKTTIEGKLRHDTPVRNRLGDKWFSVPWLPFECTLHQLHKDGLWKAYLRDDLDAIRERYGSAKKRRVFGFAGYPWPWRTRIAGIFDGDERFVFRWADCAEKAMPPAEYLRWLSECEVSMCLPGDTWKCSRFAESVMMGVPVVHPRGVVDLTPPLSSLNAILVGEWEELADMRVADLDLIVANADKAYREGWGLRGQFSQHTSMTALYHKRA